MTQVITCNESDNGKTFGLLLKLSTNWTIGGYIRFSSVSSGYLYDRFRGPTRAVMHVKYLSGLEPLRASRTLKPTRFVPGFSFASV